MQRKHRRIKVHSLDLRRSVPDFIFEDSPQIPAPPPFLASQKATYSDKKSYRKGMCLQSEQDDASEPVSKHDNAQENLLSIKKMLEDNATTLRNKEEGRRMLIQRDYIFNNPGQSPSLVLPPEQGPGVIHWKPDENSLRRWKAYQTVS